MIKTKIVPPKPVVNELEELTWTLDPDSVYWLIGVLSATTDNTGAKLYNELCDAVCQATGEDKTRIHRSNKIANDSRTMTRGYRFENNQTPEKEKKMFEFSYEGIDRVVYDPIIEGQLLKGFELRRGNVDTEQFKSYRLDKIGKNIPLFRRY